MAVQHQIITVGTAATAVGAATDPSADFSHTLIIKNTGTTDVMLGSAGVTATDGFTLTAGATLPPVRLNSGESLFAITAVSGTLAVLRIGV